jgi:biotin carboxylase
MRRLLASGGVSQPEFAAAAVGELGTVAAGIGYPVVVKPIGLTASRGVIRLDGAGHADRVEQRIRRILEHAGRDPGEPLLVEGYVTGRELAVEGVLDDGELEVLAVIDKPGSLEGPYFEETLFVTPSRLSRHSQDRAIDAVQQAAKALGLSAGPVHAEVRLTPDHQIRVLEVAARSIGGLCGRSLTFGLVGESLEVVVLRAALGDSIGHPEPGRPSTGVLMLPIPASGVLTGVDGIDAVRDLPGIDDIEITIPIGRRVQALPEGDRYLGFVFASGMTPDDVEAVLREATAVLTVTVDGEAIETAGFAAPA